MLGPLYITKKITEMQHLTLFCITFGWISGPKAALLIMAYVASIAHGNGDP